MAQKIRWGVLGVAKIAVDKVIPAMQRGEFSQVISIASRDLAKAQAAATRLGISRAHGSYEALLADPEVDAIYIPLPNHLHVPWSIAAARAGKHVLCEKPIGLSVAETRELIAARDEYRVKIGEAFMARTHPQWLRVKELANDGTIGELRVICGYFTYMNRDPNNIRNVLEWGGGALMDIGCYPITLSRMLFGGEPHHVYAHAERDPEMRIDRLIGAILEYDRGSCSFICGTQVAPRQSVIIFGTLDHIEVEIPFNAPSDRPTRIWSNGAWQEIPACDQYTIQGDLFSRAILDDTEVPVPLEDALRNMAVIEAVSRAAETKQAVAPEVV